MSAGYGNYLTEEDPNKRKPEGTTPSTTPTTATGGTTTPPLSFDGFIGTGTGSNAYQRGVGVINSNYDTAVNTATTNRDLGYEYAEGVKNSIYGNAAAVRAEADKNTEVARQRGIIDSRSSYQKAIGAYGSNAETLAGRGLSGSGYGEYLTADAYATHRGQVQNINADALRANREAAYTEKQTQMAADSEYLKNLYGINTEYNNAMNKAESDRTTGMYQAALGLNEDQNKAYTNLFDSASKGVSIDAIMQDGTWGDLTPEQQQAITAEAKRVATVKRDERMSEYVDLAAKGTSLEDIKAMMAINGDKYVEELTPEEYEKLSDEEKAEYDEARNFMKLIESAAESYANKQAEADVDANYNTALGLLADDWTLEEIEAHLGEEAWAALEASGQAAKIENASGVMARIKSETEGKTAKEQLLTYLDLAASGKYTLEQLVDIAKSLGHYDALSNIDENENETGLWASVVGKFNETESENVKNETLTNIDNAIADGATLEDIQGMEGYDKLDPDVQEQIGEQVTERDEEKEITVDSVVANLFVPGNEVYSLDDLDTVMRAERVPPEMREEIISRWQSENVDRAVSEITNNINTIHVDEILQNASMYGEEGIKTVVSAFTKAITSEIDKNGTSLVQIAGLLAETNLIPEDLLTGAALSEIKLAVGKKISRADSAAVPTNLGGIPIKEAGAVTDETTIDALDVLKLGNARQYVAMGNEMYYFDGSKWIALADDRSKPQYLTSERLENADIQTGLSVTDLTVKSGCKVDEGTNKALKEKFPNAISGFVVRINGRFYIRRLLKWEYIEADYK